MMTTSVVPPSRLPFSKWWPAVIGALCGVALRLIFTGAPGRTWSAMNPEFLLLAPFAPHLAEEIWRALGKTGSLAHELWPAADDALLVDATFPLVVQIQGKRRAELAIPQGTSEDEIKRRVLADTEVMRHLAGQTPRRVIYVPGKLINIVV